MQMTTWLPDKTERVLAKEWFSDNGVDREPSERGTIRPNQASVACHTRLHRELIGFLRQHSAFCDQRHLVLLAWMVAGLLLSQTLCFDNWMSVLPLGHCRVTSWQRRCRRWLSNVRIDVEAIYGPLIHGSLHQWKSEAKPSIWRS
jgi:hypothetical protein